MHWNVHYLTALVQALGPEQHFGLMFRKDENVDGSCVMVHKMRPPIGMEWVRHQ